MKEDKLYSLQDAKNEVAKKYGYSSWFDVSFYQIDSNNVTVTAPYSEEVLRDEAAELYKSKATEELETQISMFQTDRAERMELVEELRKENEKLIFYSEDMSDRVKKAIAYSFDKDKEMGELIEIHHLQNKDLVEQIERLKESNKELVDALQRFVNYADGEKANQDAANGYLTKFESSMVLQAKSALNPKIRR